MRRYLFSLLLASVLGLLATSPAAAVSPDDDAVAPAPVAVQRVGLPLGLRDEAAMVLVGTALIGLAAAVRRAA